MNDLVNRAVSLQQQSCDIVSDNIAIILPGTSKEKTIYETGIVIHQDLKATPGLPDNIDILSISRQSAKKLMPQSLSIYWSVSLLMMFQKKIV